MKENEEVESITEQLYKLRKFQRNDDAEPNPYCFRDGIRKIHYMIVLHDKAIYEKVILNKILTYLEFMEFQGLEFEFEGGVMDTKLLYLKVHAPEKVILHFADLYDIDIQNPGHNYISEKRFNFRLTDLTRKNGDVFIRNGKATSCEIILILNKMLSDPATFDEKQIEGLDKMIKSGYIKDAFPLHDGPWQWTEARQQYLNDRQTLSKYWANYGVWFKAQPINLVEKYFGPNVAFFFAWYEHYTIMLSAIGLLGVVFLLMNIANYMNKMPALVKAMCAASNSTLVCPLCDDHSCAFIPLSRYCRTTTLEYICNRRSSTYSMFVAIFTAILVKTWFRKEGVLKVRWNVQHTDQEYKVRSEYRIKNPYTRISKLSKKKEHYTPFLIKVVRSGAVFFIAILSIISVGIGFLILIGLKSWITGTMDASNEPARTLGSCFMYSISQVFIIKLFSYVYVGMAHWMTGKEVPKTERQFHDSVIYKIYFFGFVNNYFPVFYEAFIPDVFGLSKKRRCLPNGCDLTLAIQVFVVVFLRSFGKLVKMSFMQIIRDSRFDTLQTSTVAGTKMYIPTWEKEYYLTKPDEMYFNIELFDSMIQLGYIGFFAPTSPMSATIASICCIIELRFKAITLLCKCRRPVPIKDTGIGSWNKILYFICYGCAICNILILILNTKFIDMEVYYIFKSFREGGPLSYFYSRYAIKDLPPYRRKEVSENITECLYLGYRFPPEHPHKYELTPVYFTVLAYKSGFVLLAQNVLALIIGVLFFLLDDVTRRVREQLHREKLYTKELRLKMLDARMQMNRSLKSDPSKKSLKSTRSARSIKTVRSKPSLT